MPSVLQDWVHDLPFMQQSVLLSNMRNADMVPKGDPTKELIKWYRRCVVKSAFDGMALNDPYMKGGGSYTGPINNLEQAQDDFIRGRDTMSLHYYTHAMHSFQILGYKHPDETVRNGWNIVYIRMVHALHLWPESEEEMDKRLGDSIHGWREREDPAGGCST